MLRVAAVSLFLAVASAAASHAGQDGQAFIGFRNDNTGVYPADCAPVTTWNEWDFKEVGEGRKKDLVPVKENRRNIVWKTPVDMYCNGGMTLVDGKLFMLADPGGIGFAGKVEPDFLGVKMICIDAATGRILWTKDLHHIDLIPEDQREKLRTALKEDREFYYNVLGAHLRWYDACWQRKKTTPPDNHAELYRKAAAEYRKYLPQVPATLEEQRASKEWKASGYVQVMFWKLKKKYFPEAEKRAKFLREYGYAHNDFFGQGSFIEEAMQTPASDGQRIYVNTYYGDAFCLDLDGNIVWKKWYGYSLDRLGGITSPILVGDLMITAGKMIDGKGACWMAIDKSNGAVVWQTPREGGKSYTCASPTHHRLPIEGADGEYLDVLYCPTGQVLRASDGKVLATEVGCHGNARPWAVEGDVLVIANGSSDGGGSKPQTWPKGTVAFRLKAKSADEVVPEKLWLVEGRNSTSRLVARDGVVYGFTRDTVESRDLLTGKMISNARTDRFTPHHLSVIAGDHLFGMDNDGRCIVVALGDELEVEGVNRLGARVYGKYDFFNQGSQPFFSGNRIFIRSYTDVYCIGDPDKEIKLSAAHAGGGRTNQ